MNQSSMPKPGPDAKVSNDEILETVASQAKPFATAQDVAAETELSARRLRIRMNKLAEEGELARENISGNAVVYWIPDDTPS